MALSKSQKKKRSRNARWHANKRRWLATQRASKASDNDDESEFNGFSSEVNGLPNDHTGAQTPANDIDKPDGPEKETESDSDESEDTESVESEDDARDESAPVDRPDESEIEDESHPSEPPHDNVRPLAQPYRNMGTGVSEDIYDNGDITQESGIDTPAILSDGADRIERHSNEPDRRSDEGRPFNIDLASIDSLDSHQLCEAFLERFSCLVDSGIEPAVLEDQIDQSLGTHAIGDVMAQLLVLDAVDPTGNADETNENISGGSIDSDDDSQSGPVRENDRIPKEWVQRAEACMDAKGVSFEDACLLVRGFKPEDCSNQMFKAHSTEYHTIRLLESIRADEKYLNALKEMESKHPATGPCQQGEPQYESLGSFKFSRAHPFWCGPCKKTFHINIGAQRLVAAVKGPPEDLWKLPLNVASNEAFREFQVSHLCSHVPVNRCIVPGHFLLENTVANLRRQGCATGRRKCECQPACIKGPRFVERDESRDESRETSKPATRPPYRGAPFNNSVSFATEGQLDVLHHIRDDTVRLDDQNIIAHLKFSITCCTAIAQFWSEPNSNVDRAAARAVCATTYRMINALVNNASANQRQELLDSSDETLPQQLQNVRCRKFSCKGLAASYWIAGDPFFRRGNSFDWVKMLKFLDKTTKISTMRGVVAAICAAIGIVLWQAQWLAILWSDEGQSNRSGEVLADDLDEQLDAMIDSPTSSTVESDEGSDPDIEDFVSPDGSAAIQDGSTAESEGVADAGEMSDEEMEEISSVVGSEAGIEAAMSGEQLRRYRQCVTESDQMNFLHYEGLDGGSGMVDDAAASDSDLSFGG